MLITDLIRRALQGNRDGSNPETDYQVDQEDRSSMADFVRILLASDREDEQCEINHGH
jgi:hypothetical protein